MDVEAFRGNSDAKYLMRLKIDSKHIKLKLGDFAAELAVFS